jgi:thioredoxin 1
MSDVISVDDSNFESEVIKSKLPVLVDFSAEWCGPCKRMSPILDKFAKSYLDKVKVVKIDVDASPGIASTYYIRSIPSLVIFNNGNNLDMKVGLVSFVDLENFVLSKI